MGETDVSNQYPGTIQVPKSPNDTDINKAVLDLLAKINDTNNYTDEQLALLQDKISILSHPIGEIQIQLPGQVTPQSLYGGIWLNITSLYSGLFFRAEGGKALAFGAGTQGFAYQEHWHVFNIQGPGGSAALASASTGSGVANVPTTLFGNVGSSITDGIHGVPQTADETRPVNQSIRIWKRSA